MSEHLFYMQQVLALAKMTPVQTRPNPQVAAIIVKNSQIIGVGVHLQAGEPHAEVHAIRQAGSNAVNATLYVNLEPCAHHGKTPPCADAVIQAGITRVVIANQDPNPLVAGLGIQKLQAAGIEVISGVLHNEAWEINKVFFHNISKQTPYVTLKVGMSLDGRIATKNNISQWITSPASRQDAHNYRITHEAILVGVGTVKHDNPSLIPHMIENPPRLPIRIILDSNLTTPLDSKVVTDNLAPTWILTTNPSEIQQLPFKTHGCKIITVADMQINTILTTLYKHKIYSLLIEGGEQIYSSFLDAKAVNQIVSYLSPQLIGSTSAKHLFAGNGFMDLQHNLKCNFTEVKTLGNDIKIVAEVIK